MDDVLELWRAGGERIALAACRGTLRALARGRGGFYLPDDLLQDLFVDFWLLAQRTPRDALWTAWRQHLRRGGSRTLRRPPQRLWQRAQRELPLETLHVEQDSSDGGETGEGLKPSEREQLVQAEDGPERLERVEALDALEASLGRLLPSQRQVLYLLAVRGLSAEEVARRLRLPSANAVHARVARARTRLARLMARPRRGPANRERSTR